MATTTHAPLTISPVVDRLTRRLAVHLQAGRYALAERIVAGAAEEIARQEEERVVVVADDTPLASLDLTVETVNLLETADILTVADVRIRTDGELLAIKEFGPARLRDVRRVTRTA